MNTDYVLFGDVARKQLGMQAQYASRYVDGRFGCANLGKDLRFLGDVDDYHSLQIHKDDVSEFVKRFKGIRRSTNGH